MRYLLLFILIFTLTGCCMAPDRMQFIAEKPIKEATLHKIRIQQAKVTKFSGLLALEPRTEGIWCVLLDATGIPLLKGLVTPDGTMQVKYSVGAIQESKLPDLLARVIEYSYYSPASFECPWYAPYRVCTSSDASGNRTKWKKLGPIRLWQVDSKNLADKGEMLTITMTLSSVRVTLQPLAE